MSLLKHMWNLFSYYTTIFQKLLASDLLQRIKSKFQKMLVYYSFLKGEVECELTIKKSKLAVLWSLKSFLANLNSSGFPFASRVPVIVTVGTFIKFVSELNIFSYVSKSIKKLHDLGFLVVVITNQSAINRGLITHDQLKKIHDAIQENLKSSKLKLTHSTIVLILQQNYVHVGNQNLN